MSKMQVVTLMLKQTWPIILGWSDRIWWKTSQSLPTTGKLKDAKSIQKPKVTSTTRSGEFEDLPTSFTTVHGSTPDHEKSSDLDFLC